MWNFTPTNEPKDRGESGILVPFIEDARADYAPYYSSDKSEPEAKAEVSAELQKLGAVHVRFQPGFFTFNQQKRYGYNIRFLSRGAESVIRVAGLPMKAKETEVKINQVRVQALLNVRDWLKAAVTSQVFTPGASPLTPYMLVDGQRTAVEVLEAFAQSGQLPQLLPPSGPTVEGEIVID
jgi:hypothetical protein